MIDYGMYNKLPVNTCETDTKLLCVDR